MANQIVDPTDLAQQKVIAELDKLRQDIRYERWKLLLATLAGLAALVGVGFERWRVSDQRKWEIESARKRAEVERMNAVVADIDAVLNATDARLRAAEGRHLRLRVLLDEVVNVAEDCTNCNKATVAELKRTVGQIPKYDQLLGDFLDAGDLQAQWAHRRASPHPEFLAFFGSTCAKEWEAVPNAAWAALNASYAIFSDDIPGVKREQFEKASDTFRDCAYRTLRIRQELATPQDKVAQTRPTLTNSTSSQ